MLRRLVFVAFLLVALPSLAQAVNPNCTGAGPTPNTCRILSDASPVPVTRCDVYKGATIYATGPTLANACNTTLPNTVGAITVTATFCCDSLGNPSAQSAPLAFNSLQPLLPPAGLRFANP
jgi:hypothetical protein